MTRQRAAFAGLAVAVLLAGGWWLLRDSDSLLNNARQEFVRGDSTRALSQVRQLLARDPDNIDALALAGDISFSQEQYDRSLEYYRLVPIGPKPSAVHAKFRSARIEMHHTGNAVAAEADFRSALERSPDDRNGLFQLASLLGIEARRAEAVPLILRLFRQGIFNLDFLVLLGTDDGALFNRSELERYRKVCSSLPGILVGLAWHARTDGQSDRAVELLERAIEQDDRFAEAHVVMAEVLWKDERIARLRSLLADDAVSRLDDPRLWLIRGQLADHEHRHDQAARCFWETLVRDPTNHTAAYKLFQHFTETGNTDSATFLQERIDALLELRSAFDVVRSEPLDDVVPIRQLVHCLEKLDRLWEAWGWCMVARDLDPNARWASIRSAQLSSDLAHVPLDRVCRPFVTPFDLSHLAVPQWQDAGDASQRDLPPASSGVSFRDDSSRLGIDFQYDNSPSPPEAGQRMYEFNGGGCGVLDADADGWPDVYFTQGCDWELRGRQTAHLDRLYRNICGRRFRDVTASAGLVENRFGTGVSVGDFDNDGFDDLYVANIGENRLFQNNGDGTFQDVSQQAGVGDPRWSTSCVVADLNADALPDIYSVNYLEGDSIFETVCRHADRQPRMCMPFHFEAAQDQLYLNLGDGRFRNATADSGVEVPGGKGLGVVAATWGGAGLNLFVANDTVANFFFTNRGSESGSTLLFEETAMPTGVALNHDGRAEGCMGIAVGDVDEDGDPDLFVTNFLYESNTLYLAQPGLTFADATRDAGLEEPSLQMLGFGVQCIDADLDGWLDLVVANGHIDDYRAYGRPYSMEPQFYRNSGGGHFVLQAGADVGPYFTQKHLGRSLARWDWNRDGREDLVISNLDQPAAVLTNTTEPCGRFLAVRLKGVISPRDAIGASITVRHGRHIHHRQLTGGDGYQASNQRLLVFGLADSTAGIQLDLTWPSGKTESYTDLEPEREYLFVESIHRVVEISAFDVDAVQSE